MVDYISILDFRLLGKLAQSKSCRLQMSRPSVKNISSRKINHTAALFTVESPKKEKESEKNNTAALYVISFQIS